jgi:hypothetical protein
MIRAEAYVDLYGNCLDVLQLDDEERQVIADLHKAAEKHPDPKTAKYENYFVARVGDFYTKRGLSRRQITGTVVWRIGQDIDSRLMIAAGLARRGDYRDELENLIRTRFATRRAFCEATGLAEDMLSHVLAKRKNLGIQTLADALGKVGYTIHISPLSESK